MGVGDRIGQKQVKEVDNTEEVVTGIALMDCDSPVALESINGEDEAVITSIAGHVISGNRLSLRGLTRCRIQGRSEGGRSRG